MGAAAVSSLERENSGFLDGAQGPGTGYKIAEIGRRRLDSAESDF
jgi:hypothetical protein